MPNVLPTSRWMGLLSTSKVEAAQREARRVRDGRSIMMDRSRKKERGCFLDWSRGGSMGDCGCRNVFFQVPNSPPYVPFTLLVSSPDTHALPTASFAFLAAAKLPLLSDTIDVRFLMLSQRGGMAGTAWTPAATLRLPVQVAALGLFVPRQVLRQCLDSAIVLVVTAFGSVNGSCLLHKQGLHAKHRRGLPSVRLFPSVHEVQRCVKSRCSRPG